MIDGPARDQRVLALPDSGPPVLLMVLTAVQLAADPPVLAPALVAVLAMAAVLPLAVRRRHPVAVAVLVGVAVVGLVLVDGRTPTFASFLAVSICCYSLGRHASGARRAAGLMAVAAAVGVETAIENATRPFAPFELVYPLVYFGGATVIGFALRVRAERGAALLEREVEVVIAQERARIARELHDVVAHGISLMVVQAEAAEEVLYRGPEAVLAPLHRIQETGRQSLGEMRRLLGVLRTDAGSTTPQPSLDLLGDLVAEAAEAGLTVDVEVSGTPEPMPPGLQLAAYRIVQEALTNTRRHSGASTATVRLDHRPGLLHVEIDDDGRGPAGFRAGHGVVGMRERVALYGGMIEVGPRPGGGCRVAADLPLTVVMDFP